MTHSGPIFEPGPPPPTPAQRSMQAVKTGVSFGSALAIAISWSEHHSIVWAILHGVLSWFYVVWFALTRAS